jgi:hypothetical protein
VSVLDALRGLGRMMGEGLEGEIDDIVGLRLIKPTAAPRCWRVPLCRSLGAGSTRISSGGEVEIRHSRFSRLDQCPALRVPDRRVRRGSNSGSIGLLGFRLITDGIVLDVVEPWCAGRSAPSEREPRAGR